MSVEIPDGSYDVFVVDAEPVDPSHTAGGADRLALSLTIIAGPLKGQVLDLAAAGLGRDSIDLIGMPGTLVVDGGAPSLNIDDA